MQNDLASFLLDHIFEIISLLLTIGGGLFALFELRNSVKNNRANYVNDIVHRITDNSDIQSFLNYVEYGNDWYTDKFHHGTDEERAIARKADKTLFNYNYVCYLIDEKIINSEIESGKAVYQFLAHNDYDEAAKQYLMLVQKKAAASDIKEAMQQAKRFLDTVICDDELFGSIGEVPAELTASDHWAPKFLVALLSLYAGEYEQALAYADSVLAQHQCQEALYVKSRSLAKLERYQEADAVNVLMGEMFDMSTPDVKVLYMIAMLNEMHIGDPGLNLMQELIKARPKYDKGILSLRFLMNRKGLSLAKTSDDPRELVDDFNSDIANDEFAQKLTIAREKAPKAVEYLLRLIKKQVFSEE